MRPATREVRRINYDGKATAYSVNEDGVVVKDGGNVMAVKASRISLTIAGLKSQKPYNIAHLLYEAFVAPILKYQEAVLNGTVLHYTNVVAVNRRLAKEYKVCVTNDDRRSLMLQSDLYDIMCNKFINQVDGYLIKPYYNYLVGEDCVFFNPDDTNCGITLVNKKRKVQLTLAGKKQSEYSPKILMHNLFYGTELTAADNIEFIDGNKDNWHYRNLRRTMISISDDSRVVVSANNTDANNTVANAVNEKIADSCAIPCSLFNPDAPMQWRKLWTYEGEYEISEFGDVKSVVTGTMLKHCVNKESYHIVTLRANDDVGKKTPLVHRLVFASFNGRDIVDGLVIDHINQNRQDNHVSNLREVTYSENSLNLTRGRPSTKVILQYTPDGKFIREWPSIGEIERICSEIKTFTNIPKACREQVRTVYGSWWKYASTVFDLSEYVRIVFEDGTIPHHNYMINRSGTVLGVGNSILLPAINSGKQIVSITTAPYESITKKVHRLVAIAFIPTDDTSKNVIHINGDLLDNRVENLQWATDTETAEIYTGKPVCQIDPATNEIIAKFASISAASLSIDKERSHIRHACKQDKYLAYGYYWKYL